MCTLRLEACKDGSCIGVFALHIYGHQLLHDYELFKVSSKGLHSMYTEEPIVKGSTYLTFNQYRQSGQCCSPCYIVMLLFGPVEVLAPYQTGYCNQLLHVKARQRLIYLSIINVMDTGSF